MGGASRSFGTMSDESTIEKEETEKMNEDYKAEVLEIAKLCKLAHAEHKLPEFLEKNLNAEQVKEALLASMNTQEEISSKVYQKESTTENPVIAAAKRRAQIN